MLRKRIRIQPSRGRNVVQLVQVGIRQQRAESSSSSYGPIVRLLLLSTPPRGDAVTFDYRPENVCLEGTCTLLFVYARRRTRVGEPAHQCAHTVVAVGQLAHPTPLPGGAGPHARIAPAATHARPLRTDPRTRRISRAGERSRGCGSSWPSGCIRSLSQPHPNDASSTTSVPLGHADRRCRRTSRSGCSRRSLRTASPSASRSVTWLKW